MKRAIVILLLCIPSLMVLAQNEQQESNIVYVKAGADGDGSSWDSPAGDLQQILLTAKSGQEIWVAAGTYLTSISADRTESFIIPDGVKLYGGFAGYELSIEERDFLTNETILSGEIGTEGMEDNAYTVVYTESVSNATQVDGFIITGGNANKKESEGSKNSCGGGWFNNALASESDPVVKNCIFQNNRAYFGAGIYNNAEQGSIAMILDACEFIGNIAKFDGGAIVNNGTGGQCNISILYSVFLENEAYYGAGIINKAEITGEANPYIKNVRFEKNLAYMKGSPIYNNRTGEGTCNPIMVTCVSIDNQESVRTPESRQIKLSTDKKQPKRKITISATTY